MIKFQAKKKKSTQYVIGGTVAVIILGLWISLPLMTGSSLDSSASSANPFSSRAANLSLLGSEISAEGGAPGSPLSGAMIDNPATSGEEIASSLFQSGLVGDEAAAPASADAGAPAPGASASASASAGAPAPSGPRGKLNASASLTGGNANSMSSGGKHDKFFGGAGSQKSELAPLAPADLKKLAGPDKKSGLVAMLSNSADKSALAAKTGDMNAAKGGASAAFANTAKAGGSDLSNDLESKAVGAGMQMGQTAQDLKKNDPSLNKTKVTPPAEPEDVTDKDEEMKQQIKMMIIQMVLKSLLGAVFGLPAA
ncbi:MAG: hypothetical protein Q8O90_04390 [Elusimicrobiota bacterium]|nr:hypothetical protein [Elusimicrobiota bacterium]